MSSDLRFPANPPQPFIKPEARKPWQFQPGNKLSPGQGGLESARLKEIRAKEAAQAAPAKIDKSLIDIFKTAMLAYDPEAALIKLLRHNPIKAQEFMLQLLKAEGMGLVLAKPQQVIIETKFPGVGSAQSDFDQYAVAEENVRLKKQIESIKASDVPLPAPSSDIQSLFLVSELDPPKEIKKKKSWEDI